MKRILSISAFLFMAFAIFSCEKKEQDIPVSSVSLSQATAEMITGETVQLKATVLPSNATLQTVTWASSKQSVASVSGSGLVTAITEGTSTITASAGGQSATCIVTVSRRTIPVSEIRLSVASIELAEDEVAEVVAYVYPDNADDKTVIWSSEDGTVASVNDGLITAHHAGTARIQAKSGECVAYCTVTVYDPKPHSVDMGLSVQWATFNVGSQKPEILGDMYAWGETETKNEFSWDNYVFSRGENVVTKYSNNDRKGTLELIDDAAHVSWGKGWRLPTIEEWKELFNNCTIQRIDYGEVSGFKCKSKINGESIILPSPIIHSEYGVAPQTHYWSSTLSSSSVYSVLAQTCDFGIYLMFGGFFWHPEDRNRSLGFYIRPVKYEFVDVSSITIVPNSVELSVNDKCTLTASVLPENASDKTVSWSTSDPSVATVDAKGTVIAIGPGTTRITATAGEKSATCDVAVRIPVSGVTLNMTSLSLAKGASSVLVATVYPESADNKTVTWSSSNTSVATVTNGTVVAVGGGVTEISVKTQDGGYEAKCSVTVQVSVIGISLNTNSIDIYRYDVETLKATVYPNDATNKTVSWSSSAPSIVSVDSNGKITGVSGGSATITVKTADGGFTAQCYVTVTDDGHQAVDLGLSVKWATTNYGTTSSTATGGYYLWGDPTGTAIMPYYTAPSVNSISGTQYDIVRKNWGGNWRIPTSTELSELYSKCTWRKETISGKTVFRVTGPNGNSIIVPPTGLAFPSDGPAGTTSIISGELAYLLSGTSYSDKNGRFAYIYYYDPSGSYGVNYYNVDLIKATIRPVR